MRAHRPTIHLRDAGQAQRLARLAPAWRAESRSGDLLTWLDATARRDLTADLLAATRGRTTLLITHDLGGLDRVDEIVVLDHGRVAERGRRRALRPDVAAAGRCR